MHTRLVWLTVLAAICLEATESAIIQNPKLKDIGKGEEGLLELRPNGTLILRSTLDHAPNGFLQQTLLFKTILNAIRMVPAAAGNTLNELSVKIYGEGVEHKFPPFLERVIQRIQTYFSVYKYTDTSEPLRDKYTPIPPINDTLYEEIDVNLGSDDDDDDGDNHIEIDKNKTVKPMMNSTSSMTTAATTTTTGFRPKPNRTSSTSSTIATIVTRPKPNRTSSKPASTTTPVPLAPLPNNDEENEFIELKKHKIKGKS